MASFPETSAGQRPGRGGGASRGWPAATGLRAATLTEHTDGILCVEWLGGGALLTGAKDSTVKSCSIVGRADPPKGDPAA